MITDDDYPYRAPPGSKTWQPELPPVPPIRAPALFANNEPTPAWIIAGAVALLSLGNAALMPIAEAINGPGSPGFLPGIFCTLALAGSIGAQAALLTILAVYMAGPLWLRLIWHWSLAAFALLTWCLGFCVAVYDKFQWAFDAEFFLAAVCGLPLVALACQAPHWLMRVYLHWRIDQSDVDSAVTQSRPLAISDFLVGTVVVALTITAVRVGKPLSADEVTYWAGWSIGAASAAAISLATVLPSVKLLLGVSDWRLGALGVGLLAVLAAVLLTVGLIYLAPAGGPSNRLRTFFAVAIVFGFMSALAGTLGIIRWQGFRLVMHRTGSRTRPSVTAWAGSGDPRPARTPAVPTDDGEPPTA